MKIKGEFGNKIKILRKNAGISQEKLAELAGIDRTYISSIEKGERNVSIVTIEKLSAALKVTIKDLF
ncbi:helix-turn-helix transcriptional regulator [Candidatus Woesearchaeota archaeon]|jgi:transcriptional regulator with XRE-family HTH domain|nr:helix-turn-helix transcriptional regulator [Candidatus Woesearchaeota archaeon]MBT7557991.1 helix-turn-helix transcriptional regulator [Candidatus Woesearchaeota archaeon]